MDWQDVKQKLVQFLLNNIAWAICLTVASAIAAAFSTLVSKLSQTKLTVWMYISIISVIILVIGSLYIIIYLIYKHVKTKKNETGKAQQTEQVSNNKLKTEVKHVNAVFEFNFNSREEIEARQIIDFEVMQDKLPQIEQTIGWTGDAYIGSELEDNSLNYTIEDSDRRRSPHHVKIKFGYKMRQGETGNYTLKTVVTDTLHEMEPHFQRCVTSETQKLTIRVTTKDKIIKNVEFIECYDQDGRLTVTPPKSIQPKKINNLYIYEKEVVNPELLHYYKLQWQFH